jgi:hypothetical protein
LSEGSGFMLFFDHRQDEGHGQLPQSARIDSALLKANSGVTDQLSLEGRVGWDQQRVDTTAAPVVGQERYDRQYDTLSGGLTMTYSKRIQCSDLLCFLANFGSPFRRQKPFDILDDPVRIDREKQPFPITISCCFIVFRLGVIR